MNANKKRGYCPLRDKSRNYHYEEADEQDEDKQAAPDDNGQEAEPNCAGDYIEAPQQNEADGADEGNAAQSEAASSGVSLCGFVHCGYLLCFS